MRTALLFAISLIAREPVARIGDAIPVYESSRVQSVPAVFAHAAGVRVLWREDGDLLVADFDRNGSRHGAATIATGVERFFAAASGTDTLIAWHDAPGSIVAAIVDRERNVVVRVSVVMMDQARLTNVACTLNDCAIGWSLPRFTDIGRDVGYIARFAPNGMPIGAPVRTPLDWHVPWLVAGDRDYLVLLRGYDIGREIYSHALFRDGSFLRHSSFGSRSVGMRGFGNGREWVLLNYPMTAYFPFGLLTRRVDAEGRVIGGSAYERPRFFDTVVWNGTAWIGVTYALGGLAAGIFDDDGRRPMSRPPVVIDRSFDRDSPVSASSAGDGVVWVAYVRGKRVLLRAVEIFR